MLLLGCNTVTDTNEEDVWYNRCTQFTGDTERIVITEGLNREEWDGTGKLSCYGYEVK